MSQGTCHIKAAFPISLPGILLLLGISGVRAETEYLLLDMRADDLVIAESLLTLKTESTYLVGLDDFLVGLDFPIAQDQQEWSGWFRNETLRFRWDVRESQINYGVDQQHQLQPGQWLTNRDGTFVAVGVLESIFGLTLVIDERNQAISLTSRVPLAFQTSRARAQARRRIQTRVKRKEIEGVTIADAYRWATLPMFDSTVNSSLTSRQGTRSSAHNANLSLTMDLLKHSIRYVGSRSYRSQESARGTQRMTVRRSARTREEDLFLGVRHLSFGDLFGTQNELVGGRGAGVGISLVGGSRRGDHDVVSETVAIKGDSVPGWEAELFRNGLFIAFTTVDDSGRYHFPEQELSFGENQFLVKLHGPQGQHEEHPYVYHRGRSITPGESRFALNHIDFTNRLLDGPLSSSATPRVTDQTDVRVHYNATGKMRLTGAVTNANVKTLETFRAEQYRELGVSYSLPRGELVAKHVDQAGRGHAQSIKYLTQFAGHHLNLLHRRVRDFDSPFTLQGGNIRQLNQLAVGAGWQHSWFKSYLLRVTHRQNRNGEQDLRFFNRLGFALGGMSMSHDYNRLQPQRGKATQRGSLRMAGRLRKLGFTGQLDYDPGLARPLAQVATSLRWNVTPTIFSSTTLRKELRNRKVLRLAHQFATRVKDQSLTVSFNVDSDRGWSLSVGLNSHLLFDPMRDGLQLHRSSLSNQGRAYLHLFHDENNNGMRDADEERIDWAAFNGQEMNPDTPGMLPLPMIPASNIYRLDTRKIVLADPFMQPVEPAYEFQTHAGSKLVIDVPLILTGDVNGYLFEQTSEGERPAVGVAVRLLDSDGRVVKETVTEFDGYYGFTSIAVGKYMLHVDDSGGVLKKPFELGKDEGYAELPPMYIYR